MIVPKMIVGKIVRGEVRLIYRPTTTRRPRVGERQFVKARQTDDIACHIIIDSVEDVLLGDVTFKRAFALGWKTSADFRASWVETHDAPWMDRQRDRLTDEADFEDMLEVARELRFRQRWAPKAVHAITFELDQTETPIMLMQGSPLTDGGKARLMSNRKIPPGRATSTAITGPEEHGYTQSAPRAMPREPEPVDATTQKLFAREGKQGWAAREKQREADRERLGLEERWRLAEIECRANGVDPEVYRESILKRIRAAERAAHRHT